jgi:hypothetical protein
MSLQGRDLPIGERTEVAGSDIVGDCATKLKPRGGRTPFASLQGRTVHATLHVSKFQGKPSGGNRVRLEIHVQALTDGMKDRS